MTPILFDPEGTVESLDACIREMNEKGGVNGIVILSCDENNYDPDTINPVLRASHIPVIGGVFPALIHENSVYKKGNIFLGLRQLIRHHIVNGLGDIHIDYEKELEQAVPDVSDGRTMIVFVDGFSKRINAFIESLFIRFGLEINYIGGGAGSLENPRKPCIMTNDGLMADCAALAFLKTRSGVGVCHGWEPLSGPFRVTESDHNTIRTLNWRPAFNVYQEVLMKQEGRIFQVDEFFDIAKCYPFGISRLGGEHIVRDLIRVNPDRSLTCIGEMPAGSFVSILHGNEDALIRAAGRTLALSRKGFPRNEKEGFRLLMDCVSRVLFLEDRFKEEVEAVWSPGQPLIGACSIGEIANCGTEFLEFYNKTTVLAIFGQA